MKDRLSWVSLWLPLAIALGSSGIAHAGEMPHSSQSLALEIQCLDGMKKARILGDSATSTAFVEKNFAGMVRTGLNEVAHDFNDPSRGTLLGQSDEIIVIQDSGAFHKVIPGFASAPVPTTLSDSDVERVSRLDAASRRKEILRDIRSGAITLLDPDSSSNAWQNIDEVEGNEGRHSKIRPELIVTGQGLYQQRMTLPGEYEFKMPEFNKVGIRGYFKINQSGHDSSMVISGVKFLPANKRERNLNRIELEPMDANEARLRIDSAIFENIQNHLGEQKLSSTALKSCLAIYDNMISFRKSQQSNCSP